MGLSKTKYKCSKCGRIYDYHNHAVYVDTQSQTLVMKCPTDGAVAFWYDGEISSYEVEGAFDLMDVKVDNESKSVIFTMNRDETKQDRLSVKTDTPDTVDISLKKDVLQVDVKKSNTSSNNGIDVVFYKDPKMQNHLDHHENHGHIAYYITEKFNFVFAAYIDVNLNLVIDEHGFDLLKNIEKSPNRLFKIEEGSNNIYTHITKYLQRKNKQKPLSYETGHIKTKVEFCKKSNVFGSYYDGYDVTNVHNHDIEFKYIPPTEENPALVFKLNDNVIDYIDKTINDWENERVVLRVTDFNIHRIA